MLSQAFLINMEKNKQMEKKYQNRMLSPSRQNPNSPYKYTMNRRQEILQRNMSRIPPRFPPQHRPMNKSSHKKNTKPQTTVIQPKVASPKNSLTSIIMVTDNDRKFIYHAIYTILKQSHTNLELLIIDNNSEDGTVEFVKNLKDSRIKIYGLKDKTTITNCLNLGLYVSKGQFITFQNPRYISTSERLGQQVNQLINNPKSVSIVGEQIQENSDNVKGNYESVMISRDQLETFGYFYDNDENNKPFLEYVKRLQKYSQVEVQLVNDLLYIKYDTLLNGINNQEYNLDTLDDYPDEELSPEQKVEFEELVKFGI